MLTVKATIHAPLEAVWNAWNSPSDIMQWNQASPDWHCPQASNDLKVGGKLSSTMAAKDGSFSFEFWGTYSIVELHKTIGLELGDGRKVLTTFEETADGVLVTEQFEPENENPLEMQTMGWQAILNSFKTHTEKNYGN
jgi:uncharacterized protein YndB with AHSA1/START domain